MNPDDLITVLSNHLEKYDNDAFISTKTKEKEYKMKYTTSFEQTDLDVKIKIYNNPDSSSSNQLPYVVDVSKGEQGDKQKLIRYFNKIRHEVFKETKENPTEMKEVY